jgi:hypothetical protein
MSYVEIQRSIYERLTSYAPLVGVPIHDHVPQPDEPEAEAFVFPYVTIGEDISDSWDTDTETGFESVLMIHVWSRHKGRLEAKGIMSNIRDALHRYALPVTGLNVLLLDCESANMHRNDDGTYHGEMTFRLLAEEL